MELMIEMLRNRADVNAQDNDGTTPIHRLDVTGCDWATEFLFLVFRFTFIYLSSLPRAIYNKHAKVAMSLLQHPKLALGVSHLLSPAVLFSTFLLVLLERSPNAPASFYACSCATETTARHLAQRFS